MLQEIESILQDRCGLSKDRLIVVGVSGGPDSLCLLELLCGAGYAVRVGHFNHRLRAEADSESAEVARMAERLSVEFVGGSADVRQHSETHGLSLEAAARELRYAFLFSEARAHGAQAVAVGHTADDQIETVLMHFLRGSGLRGLGGMSRRTIIRAFDPAIPVVRPLLGFWRSETEAYCASRGLVPLRDASNESPDYLRNRVRLELIPALEKYNPRIRDTILRNAAALSSDQGLLDELMEAQWDQALIRADEAFVALDLTALEVCSPALQRQLIRRAGELLAPTDEMEFSALDRAVAFIANPSARQADLAAGLSLRRESGVLYVALAGASLPSGAWPQMPAGADQLDVSIPGKTHLAGGWQFEAGRLLLADESPDAYVREVDRFRADLDGSTLPASLQLRIPRPGDRFQPLGLGGHSQKLSDFFVNEKVPARARARWPLLCSADTVVWIPGFRLAEPFKLTSTSRQIARFCLKPKDSG